MSFSILDNANCHWHLFKFWFLVEECINIEFAIKSIKVIFIDLICRQAASTVIPLFISKHIVCIYLSAIGFYLFTSRFLNSKILQIWNYIFIVNNIILYKWLQCFYCAYTKLHSEFLMLRCNASDNNFLINNSNL